MHLSPNMILIQPDRHRALSSNSILINDETNVLIDTGFQFRDGKLLKLKERTLSNLGLILYSHYHIDHTFGSWVFKDHPKRVHSVERKALGSLRDFISFSYNTDQVDESRFQQWAERFMTFMGLDGISSWDELGFDNLEPTDYTNPLNLGKTILEFIHLPGHSPGHTGFYSPNDGILFICDIVVTARFGPWYGWRNSSLPAFRESVDYVRSFLDKHEDIRWVLTSHSRPLERIKALEYLDRFEKQFDVRKGKIREFICNHPKGVTPTRIANEAFIYGNGPFVSSTPRDIWMVFEQNHIEHHLNELEELDSIYQEEGKYFAQNYP